MTGIFNVTFADSTSTQAPVKAVKNGFIHFHSPAAVAKPTNFMQRSKSLPALAGCSDVEVTSFVAHAPSPKKASGAAEAFSLPEVALEIRTPSTTCSSPHSAPHVLLEATWKPRSVDAADHSSSGRKTFGMPFASLLLPAWAMEKAAAAQRPTEFGDLQSWYSESPRSTPSSSPLSSPVAVWVDLKPVKQFWADMLEEEDAEDTCDSLKTFVENGTSFGASATLSSVSTLCPGQTAKQGSRLGNVLWADMADEDEYQDADVSTAASSPCWSPVLEGLTVQPRRPWADLAEEEQDGEHEVPEEGSATSASRCTSPPPSPVSWGPHIRFR